MDMIEYLMTHPFMMILAIAWGGFGITLIFILYRIISRKGITKYDMMFNQEQMLKAENELLKRNKDVFVEIGKTQADIENSIAKTNKDTLKETADMQADIHKDAVKTIAHSIKEGFTGDSSTYCKYCGAAIDADSRFCKKCGKQL